MYSFEQLKIFVTVCECGSFSAAARKLKRAQSGVSQSVANLEVAINQELFLRDKNIPRLTSNGQALLPIAKSILNQQQYFDQKVESLDNSIENELVIAIDECLVSQSILKVLSMMAEQFPTTHFEVITASTYDIEELVRSSKAHVGIIFSDGELKEDMDFFTLGQTRFLYVTSPTHPLANLTVVRDSDLKMHRQIVHRNATQKELWFSYGISSKFWYANRHDMLAKLASQGTGWALIPDEMAVPFIAQGELVHLPVAHEIDGWLTTNGCLVSRCHSSGPVLERLLEALKFT
ncbi:LysR family transcriptional regulator [Shewanella schlegeliana]|uniref:LysR family transcriptional regulator n=1 Tax=Shewanella schlegeliana TaxID=190308 RepID=A0ABS1SXF4_9GAMM|nr:LysR family transcriptional regulator [Shewanella schlegeliana]MBL4913193.1 LysR family transcriptional regulator [Shewanella schlegeliana]MCL1109149.1 LysR family transcriptional regulator [Shewanella schlegeliana]GIU24094.1 LysR family transcriptional regulator [Shewanella schlegeliana]